MKRITVRMGCTECHKGELKYNGMILTSYPEQYVHECSSCKAKKNISINRYPYDYLKFEPHEEETEWLNKPDPQTSEGE